MTNHDISATETTDTDSGQVESSSEAYSTAEQSTKTIAGDRLKTIIPRLPPSLISLTMGFAFLVIAVAPVAAQSSVGDVYCDTGVETGIGIIFSAVAGLGLPATGYYTGKAGLSYMRAGGNPEKKNEAKERLVMAGIGFGIITLALISPELIDKIGSQMGFGFSDCVKPF